MKKIAAKVMAALLILTLLFALAACGREQAAPEPTAVPATAEESTETEAPEITEETGDAGAAFATEDGEIADLG